MAWLQSSLVPVGDDRARDHRRLELVEQGWAKRGLLYPSMELLELPYKGREMSMAIVLPAEDSSLEELESTLTAEVLTGWFSRLRAREMVIEMPRFSIDAEAFSLVDALASLGVTSLFDAATCDLSKACRNKVHVEDVRHKTYLRVTEEGTEAAAVTALLAAESKPPKRRFIANRPFLSLIRDLRDGSILFMGRVTDPRS